MLSKCYIVQLYDFKFWQLEGADPIYTVNTLETVKTSKASVPAQSSRKFNGESEMSEIFRIVCIMCPNTSKPGQLNQVTNQFITDCSQRRKKTTATRHFGTLHNALQCFTQRKIRNKPSSNPFKLQAPSDPEVFLQITCSSSCWGTHHGPLRLFDAELHIAVTPALGVLAA